MLGLNGAKFYTSDSTEACPSNKKNAGWLKITADDCTSANLFGANKPGLAIDEDGIFFEHIRGTKFSMSQVMMGIRPKGFNGKSFCQGFEVG